MDKETLRKLQMVELSILIDIDAFCRKHEINYSLYGGTALGAVRHHGFIPWDDDVDICMIRNDYDRFLSLWRKERPKGYYLQGTDDRANRESHSKIRKEGTLYCSREELKEQGCHGIWVDVFVLDKVPEKNGKARKRIVRAAAIRAVYTRRYPYTKGSKRLYYLSKIMLLLPERLQIIVIKKCNQKITKYKDMETGYYPKSNASVGAVLNSRLPADMMKRFTDIDFEGKKLMITAIYDEYLKCDFGDYMTLPPEEKRICIHEAEIIKL